MATEQYNQGDAVCVDLGGHEAPGPGSAENRQGVGWQEAIVMAVMPDGRYRVGLYDSSEELIVTLAKLRPRREGARCDELP